MALRRSHFQCGKCEGRRSQSSAARTPSLALPPSGARKEFCVVVCAALLTFVCMLRYSEWNVVPIWFLYSSVLMVVRCADLRSAIWFWDSSVLIVVRWADLVPVFFDIYGDTLYQSSSCILRYLWWYAVPIPFLYSSILIGIFCTSLTFQDRTPSPLPSHAPFFSCRLEASARGRWHRAGLLRRRGDYYLGCGRRRYCGRVCCLSRRRVLALPQCF